MWNFPLNWSNKPGSTYTTAGCQTTRDSLVSLRFGYNLSRDELLRVFYPTFPRSRSIKISSRFFLLLRLNNLRTPGKPTLQPSGQTVAIQSSIELRLSEAFDIPLMSYVASKTHSRGHVVFKRRGVCNQMQVFLGWCVAFGGGKV